MSRCAVARSVRRVIVTAGRCDWQCEDNAEMFCALATLGCIALLERQRQDYICSSTCSSCKRVRPVLRCSSERVCLCVNERLQLRTPIDRYSTWLRAKIRSRPGNREYGFMYTCLLHICLSPQGETCPPIVHAGYARRPAGAHFDPMASIAKQH